MITTTVSQKAMNNSGIKQRMLDLVLAGKVEEAIPLFDNNDKQIEECIKEYNTKTHKIMNRLDKVRSNKDNYQTNKLPLNMQQYINEVALFFFLGNPLRWELDATEEEMEELMPTFQLFLDTLEELHYDSRNRTAKRIAGAESECAKLYDLYNDEDDMKLKINILSYSDGYELRPLFNRHGDLKAFGVGYYLRADDDKFEQHFDIYTSEEVINCHKLVEENEDWIIIQRPNPIKKIPVIYIRQPKEWAGVEERIERLEWADSKNADTVEYFADPYLKIDTSIVNDRLADAEEVGKVIKVKNKDAVFEFVTPVEAPQMKKDETQNLRSSILEGSFTPDFNYENIKGLGAISADAQQQANIRGHIKRQNRMETYDELFKRERNLILAIMENVLYPEKRKEIRKLKIKYLWQDPYIGGMSDNSEELVRLFNAGIMSLETAVDRNRNVVNKDIELSKIREEAKLKSEKAKEIVQTEQNSEEEEDANSRV